MSTTQTTPPPTRTLRRVRDGRVGAGVAAGLGRYFGLDPVLFRVLFATSAFFGGAGVIAYLLAWAAIPEEGTGRAPIDGAIAELRRRHVPVWAVAVAAGLAVWLLGFSWWAPGPFLPVLAVVVLLIVAFGRRQLRWTPPPAPPVDLTKDAATPTWTSDLHAWVGESRAAGRRRAERALPVKIATLVTLIVTLTVLGIVDGVTGISLGVYFWAALAIVGLGLLTGVVLRRTPWSLITLLVPVVAGTVAFAGTSASLHDGTGQREWKPTGTVHTEYRLAFGRATLDLTALPALTTARTVHVTLAAGQVRIVAPKGMNLQVDTSIRFGRFVVDGQRRNAGVGISSGEGQGSGTAPTLTVHVDVEEGEVVLVHR